MFDIVGFYLEYEVVQIAGFVSWLGVVLVAAAAVLRMSTRCTVASALIVAGTLPFVLEPGVSTLLPLHSVGYDAEGNTIFESSFPQVYTFYPLLKAVGVFLVGAGLLLDSVGMRPCKIS